MGCTVALEPGDKATSFESGFGRNVGVGISVKCEKAVLAGSVEALDKVSFVKHPKITRQISKYVNMTIRHYVNKSKMYGGIVVYIFLRH